MLETAAGLAYRNVTARLSYLASDRPELLFATKECGKASSCSTQADLTHLKGIGHRLLKAPRFVLHFPWQDETYVWEGFSDADACDEVEAKACKNESYVLDGTSMYTSCGVLRLG